MARIRSIHPGIFTDEAFVALSMPARVLLIGIWTEADDHGVFEWKPVMLKMRIFPADDAKVDALLEELVAVNVVAKFSRDSHEYGVVRNFTKFQKPKKPNYKHILPDEFRTYVGLKPPSSEPSAAKGGGSSEKPSLMEMEDGEGIGEERRKKESEEDSRPSARKKRGPYVFEAGVIRLNQVNFDRWKRAFINLNLEAELTSLADWAGQQDNWFAAVSGALAKRDRNVLARRQDAAKSQGPPGQLWDPGL